MTPRPRKASDEEIFAAAHRIMSRLGPAQWTLADIAAEAGLTAGALVQRFGSKRGLLLALAEQLVVAYGDRITDQARQYELAAALIVILLLIGWRSRHELLAA